MGGIAAAGVIATHWLTYRLTLPDAHHRAEVLHHTGHAHFPAVSAVGLALFTVASIRLCVLGASGRRVPGLRSTAARLILLQAAAWTALEVGERVVSDRLPTLDDHGLFVVGLGVQIVVALLGALLVRLVAEVTAAFAVRPSGARRRPPRSVPRPTQSRRPHHSRPLTGGDARRGPPRLRPAS